MAIISFLRSILDALAFLVHSYERQATICAAAGFLVGLCSWLRRRPKPVSGNYFSSRKCNKECGFCFHTAKTSFVLPQEEAHRGLRLLRRAGMQKLNISRGELFLYPKFLAAMMKFCKEELHLESVSIVTNGSKVTRDFLKANGNYIDVLAVSCDYFN
jgi:radical S-adenosyl methionine domain-containing protein 2